MATRVTLDLTGRPPRIPTAEALLGAPARRFAESVMLDGVNHLASVVPIDRGALRSSLQPGVGLTRVDGGALPAGVTWGTNLPYAGALDEGKRRGPGKAPPVAEIERWIKRRGISPTKTAKSGRVTRDRRGARAMAFAIARKIAREGTTTGPAYVAGPNKDKDTKGWFASLGPAVVASIEARRAALGRAVQEVWRAAVG